MTHSSNNKPHPQNNTPGVSAHANNDDSISAHRVRTNSRIPLEPIGYDSEGAPLWPWQVMDGD